MKLFKAWAQEKKAPPKAGSGFWREQKGSISRKFHNSELGFWFARERSWLVPGYRFLLRDCGPRRVAALTAGDRDGFGPDIREPPTIRLVCRRWGTCSTGRSRPAAAPNTWSRS